ncbi:SH3 domain-containing protein [Lysobacter enzymogenes]|nr:SH3 domain-containing protein [Lysobacter enzymogenes]
MARRSQGALGLWVIGGLIAIVAMCRPHQDRAAPPDTEMPPVAAEAPVATEVLYVDAASLNQRASPHGPVVGSLAGGSAVEVHERREGWIRVSRPGEREQWVSASHLCAEAGCYRTRQSGRSTSKAAAGSARRTPARTYRHGSYEDGTCPCSGRRVCIGPRGGRYCITSGGNKRYGV